MKPISTAPKDGTTIVGVYEGTCRCPIMWHLIRGWVTAPGANIGTNLVIDTPGHWEPYIQKKGEK